MKLSPFWYAVASIFSVPICVAVCAIWSAFILIIWPAVPFIFYYSRKKELEKGAKCPHCKSKPLAVFWNVFECETSVNKRGDKIKRTDLCREREAHNKTKEELLNAREWLDPDLCDEPLRRERQAHDKTLHELLEAREKANQWERIALRVDTERSEVREENAKLRYVAERAINFGEYRAPYLGYPGPTWEKLRAELDQLKDCSNE